MSAPHPAPRARHDRGVPPWGSAIVVLGLMVALASVIAGTRALLVPRTDIDVPEPPALQACDELGDGTDEPVSSAQLLECPDVYDGQPVRFVGEAIGHLLPRPGVTWVQLNDDVYSLGVGPIELHHNPLGSNSGMAVGLPADAAAAVRNLGGARHRGDVVEVVGTFRVAEPLDGGGTAIVAQQVRIVEQGGSVEAPPATAQRVVAVGMLVMTASLALPVALRRRR